jgi:ABC-type polysaccharide/polyol phosphate export permease
MTEAAANEEILGRDSHAALPALELPGVRRIEAVKRRLTLRGLRDDLPVVRVLAARDFKVKYKQSLLGPLWLVFQPVAMLAAFLVAFKGLADVESSGTPYILFALVGLSVWSFFQASMTIGTASLISNLQLVRFTPCPRIAFPLAGIIASLPSLAVPAVASMLAAIAYGNLSPRVLLLPFGVAWIFLLTAGAVAIAASLTVRFRDLLSAMPFLLQVGVFLAPVGYPVSELSSTVRVLVDLNPLTGVMEAWRWMVIGTYSPSFEPIGVSLIATTLLLVAGWRVFTRLETTMADEI